MKRESKGTFTYLYCFNVYNEGIVYLIIKKMTNNSNKNTLGISDVIRLSLPPFRLLIALIFSN